MDLAHFGLRARPFRSSPDTQFYYSATAHEAAIAELVQGFEREESILLLTGATGTGKTLVLHRFLETIPETTQTVFLSNPRCATRRELLQAILFELNLPYEGKSEQELRLGVTDALLREFQDGGRTLIVVDEAHHLTHDQLEELRLLTNLDGKQGKAVQVLLCAQPELLKQLNLPTLHSLRQRIATRPHLEPLSPEESHDYLWHQVRIAGGRPEKIFHEEGLQILTEVSRGIPRLLNQLASMSLQLASSMKVRQIDAEVALEAASRLGLEIPEEPDTTPVGFKTPNEEIEEEAEEEPFIARIPQPEPKPEPPPVTIPLQPASSMPKSSDELPRVLIYSGQPTGTPLERIEELLRSRRQGGG